MSSSPPPSNQPWGEIGEDMETPLVFNNLCYAMICGWYQNYNYVRNLFFSFIMKLYKIMAYEITFTKKKLITKILKLLKNKV